MPQPPNERSRKVLATLSIIDALDYSQEDLEDLTGYLAARCGLNLNPDGFSLSELVYLRSILKILEANEQFTEEDLQDLTAHLAARCGQKFVWVNPVDFSDLVEQNPAIAQILNPKAQIIYSDEKSIITVADCYPCPISGKPCPTNGAMGTISHYYYPGDCPNFKACADAATETDPCNCGKTYNNACDGDCPELTDDIMSIPLEGDFLEDHLEDIAAIFGINIDQDRPETPDH